MRAHEREVGDQQRKFVGDVYAFLLVDERWQGAPAVPAEVGGVSGKDLAPDGARPLAPIRGAPVHVAMEARNRRLTQPDSAVSRQEVTEAEVVVLERNGGEVGGSRRLAEAPDSSSTMALRFRLSMSR